MRIRVLHGAFKKIPSNGCRGIAVKVLCYANKVSFINGRLQVTLFVCNTRGVFGVDFHKIPSNGSRDIDVRVFSSTSKVPFIIGRLQPN
jgi:hypothetical protein